MSKSLNNQLSIKRCWQRQLLIDISDCNFVPRPFIQFTSSNTVWSRNLAWNSSGIRWISVLKLVALCEFQFSFSKLIHRQHEYANGERRRIAMNVSTVTLVLRWQWHLWWLSWSHFAELMLVLTQAIFWWDTIPPRRLICLLACLLLLSTWNSIRNIIFHRRVHLTVSNAENMS